MIPPLAKHLELKLRHAEEDREALLAEIRVLKERIVPHLDNKGNFQALARMQDQCEKLTRENVEMGAEVRALRDTLEQREATILHLTRRVEELRVQN